MMRLLFSLLLICSLAACGQSEAAQGGLSSIPPMAASVPLSGMPLASGFTTTAVNWSIVSVPSITVKVGDFFLVSCQSTLSWVGYSMPSFVALYLDNVGGTSLLEPGGVVSVGMMPVSVGQFNGAIMAFQKIQTAGSFSPRCSAGSDVSMPSTQYNLQVQVIPFYRQ
jgi:hypothetical protein